MKSLDAIGLDERLLKAVTDLGFEKPMPIQEKVIPFLTDEGFGDLVALAQTGTGKTAAFGLPLLQMTDVSIKDTQHLILCPTRELCIQISEDLKNYSKYIQEIRMCAVYGGTSIDAQIKTIKRGVHIIIATPGRLLDLINRKVVKIGSIRTVVLDEADEMLNMGFRDDLESILNETPSEKKTLLFSATMPREVMNIANRYMNSPTEISVGTKNAGAENVTHLLYMVHAKDRYLALKRIVDFNPSMYGIVFCRTRQETKDVAEKLMQDGYNADALHGDLSQAQRDQVMHKFRIRNLNFLVATDVAARGIDVNDLTHIINYNLPDEIELYTHRSGRTGRAGKKGTSILIANLKEKGKIRGIENQLKKKFTQMPVPGGKEICEKQLFHFIDRMKNVEVDEKQIEAFLPQITAQLELLDREDLIKKFVSLEFNRFLEYYKNTKDLNVPEKGERGERGDGSHRTGASGFTRFFINVGDMDFIKPTTIIGFIKDFTGMKDIEIGNIEILKSFSFFEVESGFDEKVLAGFENRTLKKRSISVEIAEAKSSRSSDSGRSKGGDRKRNGSGGYKGRSPQGGKGRSSGGGRSSRGKDAFFAELRSGKRGDNKKKR
ncbi:MAG: DEAD/DEAH box helicase [Bacteroidetes bacterium]|nr:DEAD/DEAH box helicase [Bacteroidota bacterium]